MSQTSRTLPYLTAADHYKYGQQSFASIVARNEATPWNCCWGTWATDEGRICCPSPWQRPPHVAVPRDAWETAPVPKEKVHVTLAVIAGDLQPSALTCSTLILLRAAMQWIWQWPSNFTTAVMHVTLVCSQMWVKHWWYNITLGICIGDLPCSTFGLYHVNCIQSSLLCFSQTPLIHWLFL